VRRLEARQTLRPQNSFRENPSGADAEDDDLEVLRRGRAALQDEQLQDTLQHDVGNGQNHGTLDYMT